MSAPFPAWEFFAGGGMAGLGLAPAFATTFANDLCPAKAASFRANHPDVAFRQGDVWDLTPGDLPGRPALAWASSPCQDLSLAGPRAGLDGARSSAFHGFARLMRGVAAQGRRPDVIVLENVSALLSANGGADFASVVAAFADLGLHVGALEVDASAFLPQSRPRLFVIAAEARAAQARSGDGAGFGAAPGVRAAAARLPADLQARWTWWDLPTPPPRSVALMDVLDPHHRAQWHGNDRRDALLALMNPMHRARVAQAAARGPSAGTLARRIRVEGGVKVQRAEVRFDGLAGCLRTPGGGSSTQFIVWAEPGRVRTRDLTAREAARLMGLADDYRLPNARTGALQLLGDGVAVPVVRHLAEHLLAPLAEAARADTERAA